MSKRNDVTWARSPDWARTPGRPTGVTLDQIHDEATRFSKKMREWYWDSIDCKRWVSVATRGVAFALGALAAISPLVAGSFDKQRIWVIEGGIVMVTVAGLLLAADRVFGWSSGWLRYTMTVVAMEQLSMKFDLDWMALMLEGAHAAKPRRPARGAANGETPAPTRVASSNGAGPEPNVAKDERAPHPPTAPEAPAEGELLLDKALQTAREFMQGLEALRTDETHKWVAEFNSGMAALDEMIKRQREVGEHVKETLLADTRARAAEARAGAIVLELTQSGPERRPCKVSLDDGVAEQVTGSSWAKQGVTPGAHRVRVSCEVEGGPARESSDIVEVEPGKVARRSIAVA